jgi:hypothetical protein
MYIYTHIQTEFFIDKYTCICLDIHVALLSIFNFYDISFYCNKNKTKPDVVVHTCNPRTWEAEAGGIAQGQPGLYSETLSHKTDTKQYKVESQFSQY